MKQFKSRSGFTLVELVIVMAVIAVVLGVVIPNLRGMQAESQLSKVEGDLNTIKAALVSYQKNNEGQLPPNIHAALLAASPPIITEIVQDPFNTDTGTGTYGYTVLGDGDAGLVWVVFSKGPRADTLGTAYDDASNTFLYSGSGKAISNVNVVKTP